MAKAKKAKKAKAPVQPVYSTAIRPTPERLRHGKVSIPTGQHHDDLPAHDTHHDCIAVMHLRGVLTDEQEMGARKWQWLRYRLKEELGVNEGRSCLDIAPAGYDATEGDPQFMRYWRDLEAELGWVKVGALDHTCIRGQKPSNLDLLRAALEVVNDHA